MKVYFNGWFSGFLEKTNPGVHVGFFLKLFNLVYKEDCEIGNLCDSDILCEFDMLIDCSGTLLEHKKWKQTYLFNGESSMRCDSNKYDIVLWGERNYGNVVNVPLFIPYIYTNNFVDNLIENKNINIVPDNDVCVIISNPCGEFRNTFLSKLEQHFKVTYAGSYKNNIGGNITYNYNTPEFLNFISKFKFVLSMENSRNDTYITEKIIHGLLANTIPVYWGSSRVFDYFNPNRVLYLEDQNMIDQVINRMKEISDHNDRWLEIVNQSNFINNQLDRNINVIANDIRCIINKGCWNHISNIYCVNNPIFEPDRHNMLKNMFDNFDINNEYVKYISPTYKTTITKEIYDKYTYNQLVKHLRYNNLSYAELSLFLNYRAVLENIEKNYKDGLFLIFESDVLISKDIQKFNDFLNNIVEKDFDLIHLGSFDTQIFSNSIANFPTGYRIESGKIPNEVLEYHKINTTNKSYIEDLTNENDEYRIIRKFSTRCTDSFLWKYSGIVKFLNFMRNFEDYSSPLDYYMCNFFENNLNFKHYWSINEFFKQGSNLNIISSTIQENSLNFEESLIHSFKFLYIKSNTHVKNHHALINYKNINITIIDWLDDFYKMDISSFDVVISPCEPIDVSQYPNIKFIFGPQFSIFPDNKLVNIKGKNVLYNLLSDWVVNIWRQYSVCENLKLIKLPFGVDTEKFCPIKPILERDKIFIYFKNRNPYDLQIIESFLNDKNYNYRIFSYKNKYNEEEYLNYLQNSKFGIWVAGHESQGFALEEALSCNVPLLVWNVKSMNQEYESDYDNNPATSIPYWDNRCGEYFYSIDELLSYFDKFINNLNNYKPREFIVENLSIEVCENRLIETIQNM